MTSTPRFRPVGEPQTDGRLLAAPACLVELRERLARRCDAAGDGHGALDVRTGVDAAVAPLLEGPLVNKDQARTADDEDLVWCAQAVQRAINILEGARSAITAEAVRRRLHARRGEASGAETLVNATGLAGALARRVEREAVLLNARPQVADALGRGVINADQAALVAGADVPDVVRSELCKLATSQTADQTRQTVRAAVAAWRRESDAQRRARQRAARSAAMWVDPDDGMWHLRAKFDSLTGDAINRLLISAIERNWRSDKNLPESQRRSVQQRAADALAWLLTSGGADGAAGAADTGKKTAADRGASAGASNRRRPRPAADDSETWIMPSTSQMIVLTTLDNLRSGRSEQATGAGVDFESGGLAGLLPAASAVSADAGFVHAATMQEVDLLAVPGAAGITEAGTVLGAAELRRIACDTQVIPVVMGGPSEVLDVGRAKRTIPPGLRRALIARDQQCVWPGCDRSPVHCDGHHIQHWIDDGPTSLANLALLCHRHHQRLHEYNLELHPPIGPVPPGEGWTVKPVPAGGPNTPTEDHVRQNC